MSDKQIGDEALEHVLSALEFTTPPLGQLWQPHAAAPSRRPLFRGLLLAAALVAVVSGLAIAATELLPRIGGADGCVLPTCGDDFQVSARISGSAVGLPFGFDVVVADGTDEHRLAAIAQGLADEHSRDRVIVWFFSQAAGQERNQFPLMPGSGQMAPAPTAELAWLATYDFRPDQTEPIVQQGSGR
jgi:hypothetical protein